MASSASPTFDASLASSVADVRTKVGFDKKFLLATGLVLLLHLLLSLWFYQLFLTRAQLVTKVIEHFAGIELPVFALYSDAVFHQWSILLSASMQPLFAVAVLLTASLPFIFRRELRWAEFDATGRLKVAITVLSVVLTWQLVTYDYNLFLDQAHYVDRALVLCLALLVWKHPGFVPLLLVAALTMLSSIRYPFEWLSITDRRLLIDTLILFTSCCAIRVGIGRGWIPRPVRLKPLTLFLFLLLCLIGASYFATAVKKIWISPYGWDWFWEGKLGLHTAFCVSRGWLTVLSAEQRMEVVRWVTAVQVPFLFAALLIEIGGLFTVVRRRLSMWLLLSMISLHLGIFAVSGILFWKWIAVDIVAIGLLYRLTSAESAEIFQGRRMVAVAIILISPFCFRPVMLGWFDTPLHNHLQLEAVGESGEVYTIDKGAMDPYDMFFQFNRFVFLVDQPLMVVGHSVRDYDVAESILNAGPDGVEQLCQEQGINHFDAEKCRVFDQFIGTYFANLNRYGGKPLTFGPASPFHHIYGWSHGQKFIGQEPVRSVRVRFIQEYYDGEQNVPLFNEIVRDVPIEPQPAGDQQAVEVEPNLLSHLQ